MNYSLWLAFLGGLGTFLAVSAGQRRAPRTLRVRLGLEQVQARRPLVDGEHSRTPRPNSSTSSVRSPTDGTRVDRGHHWQTSS